MQALAGSYSVTSAPAVEPISLSEAKAHLRVEIDDDDSYITNLIVVAREWVETFLHRKLITQTITWKIDKFPDSDPIELPVCPVQSITSIKYIDTDGAEQTWSSALYRVDTVSCPVRVDPAFGEVFPSIRDIINAVEVIFVAGYGTAGSDVPTPINQAIYLVLAELYERREMGIVGGVSTPVIFSAKNLLTPYRNMGF